MLLHITWRLELVGRELVFGPDHQIGGLPLLQGLDEDIVFVPLDLHRVASGGYASNLLGQMMMLMWSSAV